MTESIVPGEFGAPEEEYALQNIPVNLRRATARMEFPPSYVIVGVYRLFTDKNLRVPAWQKCKHGATRGAGVALGWVGAH